MNSKSGFGRSFLSLFMPLFLGLLTLLSGCVRYDVGVNFYQQHRGEIVQHIRLSEQLTSLSETEANKWLDSIENRSKLLQGRTKRVSGQELIVTIPFSNGRELTDKFNEFFNPKLTKVTQALQEDNSDLVQLKAEMSIKQSNWLFFEQNRLNIQVDLRALGVLSKQGNIIISPGSLVDLEFALNAPWGLNNIVTDQESQPLNLTESENQLVWQLKPGQINIITASFWVPSYLGLGTVGIIFLMLLGFLAKYRRFPGINYS
ncbi:DUF3153 domain-containing protein [Aphanothece sacrum]|nr:DUF3153 domain-containing protein [Aphanothece sacrum]